jgi:hypothetical protein
MVCIECVMGVCGLVSWFVFVVCGCESGERTRVYGMCVW